MRFIRKEHIITTICNEEVIEEKTINSLLNNLKNNRIEFSLTIQKYFSSVYDYKNIRYDKVRVKKVEENEVDFIIFDNNSITSLKNIPFIDIVEINAITMVDKILKIKPDLTRWEIMDIGGE